ncbi:MAG: hypothetical protein AAFQ84_06835 [Pseudomonadota bacterium]
MVNAEFVSLDDGLGAGQTITRDKVRKVAFYKTDLITYDCVMCEITAEIEQAHRTWCVSEDDESFAAFEAWLLALPGFDTDWRSKVIKPAFEENLTVAFEA